MPKDPAQERRPVVVQHQIPMLVYIMRWFNKYNLIKFWNGNTRWLNKISVGYSFISEFRLFQQIHKKKFKKPSCD